MALTPPQRDASEAALKAGRRIGMYAGLAMTLEAFRARPARDALEAGERECPLDPADYGDVLLTFREDLRAELTARGYTRMRIRLQDLCAETDPGGRPYHWAEWCDDLAETLE